VRVFVSSAAPGGHPDLQTTIEVANGELFDQVQVLGPAGGSIAQDGDLPNDVVVGRLDAVATTNALTRPTCDQRVPYSVPIRKAPADPGSPAYPSFLETAAPGRHRLRLIADVSPTPQVPVVINYLFDLDPASRGVILRAFVGDPNHPPTPLVTCAPSSSVITLFGVTPLGIPLLTAPSAIARSGLAFNVSFTSRADAAGKRQVQSVSVVATVQPLDLLPRPSPASPPEPRLPALEVLLACRRLAWPNRR
jgi:hypothetical protein